MGLRRSLNQLKKGPDKSRSNDIEVALLNQLQTLLLAKQHFESTNNSFAAQPQAVPASGHHAWPAAAPYGHHAWPAAAPYGLPGGHRPVGGESRAPPSDASSA
jgi:hypothetical protein